ncbi:MAG: VOC family protein, partial [Alphaproteobacteria bacterium]|nr:VOC family protein [Alphaproteobacteria bacterium]
MIDRIDHVVLNCQDVEATAVWYERVMGFEREEFFGPIRRIALKFGRAKINLRPVGTENWMTGAVETPGSLDLCFITEGGVAAVVERLEGEGIE